MWFDLRGDSRLGQCATEGCGGQPTARLEVGGVGSNYCCGCRASIEGAEAIQTVARALHEAHKPWCDYTYDFNHPMSGRETYEALARAAINALAGKQHGSGTSPEVG